MAEQQIKINKADPFQKQKIWSQEQLESSILESDFDTSKDFEYILDEAGLLAVVEERMPIQNKYAAVIANTNLNDEEIRAVRRHLKVIQTLNYAMKRLSKHGKKRTILVRRLISEEPTTVLVVSSEKKDVYGNLIVKEKQIEKDTIIYEEKEMPVNYFDLRPAIKFFMEKAVDITHTAKARDMPVLRLLRGNQISDLASKYAYAQKQQEQEKASAMQTIRNQLDSLDTNR